MAKHDIPRRGKKPIPGRNSATRSKFSAHQGKFPFRSPAQVGSINGKPRLPFAQQTKVWTRFVRVHGKTNTGELKINREYWTSLETPIRINESFSNYFRARRVHERLVFASFNVDSLVSSPFPPPPTSPTIAHCRVVSSPWYLAPCERSNLLRPDFSATPWHGNTREELLKSCFTERGRGGERERLWPNKETSVIVIIEQKSWQPADNTEARNKIN